MNISNFKIYLKESTLSLAFAALLTAILYITIGTEGLVSIVLWFFNAATGGNLQG